MSTTPTTATMNIELMCWWYVRNHYEQLKNVRIFPSSIKYIIRKYMMNIFISKILTMRQDLDLVQLLSRKIPNLLSSETKIKLLYRASEYDYSAYHFHKLCDNHGPTIIIIKNNFNNIFGGYTPIAWTAPSWHNGKLGRLGRTWLFRFHDLVDAGESFIFLLHSDKPSSECPKIWEYTEHDDRENVEVGHFFRVGPRFGAGDIGIAPNCNQTHSWSTGHNYIDNPLCLIGGDLAYGSDPDPDYPHTYGVAFLVLEYEVFEIIST